MSEYWAKKEARLSMLLAEREAHGASREMAYEIHELQKQLWARRHRAYSTRVPFVRQYFGKPFSELTREEGREYNKIIRTLRVGGERKVPIVRQLFGKPLSELTAEERRYYVNYLAREQRKRNKKAGQ